MAARFLHPSLSPTQSHLTRPHRLPPAASPARLRLHLLRANGGDKNGATDTSDKLVNGRAADATEAGDSAAAPASSPPPATLNIKYRPRSRRRREEQQSGGAARKPPPPKKEWDEMSLGEKAADLYVGEKGLLFWLNKFAYISIFVIAGGWILFRFVGPSLGLYQLDSSPLPPSAIFKGPS